MLHKSIAYSEAFVTNVALVTFFARVRHLVTSQARHIGGGVIALRTSAQDLKIIKNFCIWNIN